MKVGKDQQERIPFIEKCTVKAVLSSNINLTIPIEWARHLFGSQCAQGNITVNNIVDDG